MSAVIVVWYELGGTLWSLGDTSSSGGGVGPETVTLFLSSYAFYYYWFLFAYIYHRTVVIPRQRRRTLEMERQRQLRHQRLYYEQQQQGMADSDGGNATTIPVVPAEGSPISKPSDGIQNNTIQMKTSSDEGSLVCFSAVLTAFSNYDADNNQEGWGGAGVESQELTLDRPILLHGAHGLLSHHSNRRYRRIKVLMIHHHIGLWRQQSLAFAASGKGWHQL
ncbi:hypothetical protein ACA910_015673 [Epithemia clementina (nom. ined.)]